MRSFLIKSNNYRPGNLGIYNYQVNIDENSGSVTLLTNVGEYILGGNGDIKLTNYYTKEEMDNIIQDLESGEIDLTRYYTKEQIDDLLDNIETGNVDLTNYFTKTEVEEYVITQTDGYVDMATLDIITDNKISNATLDLVEKEPFNNLTSKVNTLEDRVNNIDTGDIDLSEYAKMEDIEGFITEAEVDSKINNIVVDLTLIEESLDNKVDKVEGKDLSSNDFTDSYKGSLDGLSTALSEKISSDDFNTYMSQLESDLDGRINNLSNVQITTMEVLPETGETNIIYLIPKNGENPTINIKDEYIWISEGDSGRFELIGTTEIDLSNYYTKTQVDGALNGKVDIEAGKGLSTNDFVSTNYLTKTEIETGLETKVDKDGDKVLSTNDFIASDYYNRGDVDDLISNVEVDLTGYATEGYVTDAINSINIPSIDGLITEDDLNTELDKKIDNTYKAVVTAEINDAILGLNIDTYAKIDSLEAKLDTTEFETYKTNINTSLSDLDGRIDNLSNVQITTVEVLPDIGEPNIIYLVPNDGLGDNIKDEYIWIVEDESGRFELIGTTEIDLSNYYTKDKTFTKDETSALINSMISGEIDLANYYTISDTDNAITTAITVLDLDNKLSSKAEAEHTHTISDITDLSSTLSNKVNKDGDKVLSTNDFTDSYKQSLDGLSDALDSKADKIETNSEIGRLDNKIDSNTTTLAQKADQVTTYTKAEVTTEISNAILGLDIDTYAKIDGLSKDLVGLSNVDNTSDLGKPLSTATINALSEKADKSDLNALVTKDDLLDKVNKEDGKGLSTNDFISADYLTKTEVETGLGLKANVEHNHDVVDIIGLTKASVGLSNVDDTSDLNKPISAATQTALDSKANSVHTHTIENITNLQVTLDSKANQETTYTKGEVDSKIAENSGGTTYQRITAGGSHTFGSEYENYIILTDSTTDTIITIPEGNTNYIVRNINPTGRVFFIADTGATIHASSIGLVDNDYVIVGYGMMSVIVHGTDIILTGGI